MIMHDAELVWVSRPWKPVRPTTLYRDMIDEAATQGDVMWREVSKLAGIGDFEMRALREYLVRHGVSVGALALEEVTVPTEHLVAPVARQAGEGVVGEDDGVAGQARVGDHHGHAGRADHGREGCGKVCAESAIFRLKLP